MYCFTNQNSSDQNTELQKAKESQTITQSRKKESIPCQQGTVTGSLAELISKAQNGETDSYLTLLSMFNPLFDREAGRYLDTNLFPEREDAKSQVILDFCEFISAFRNFEFDNCKIAGLIKKYLHDCRIDFAKAAARHCPDCYTIDFEKELEENSPFSRFFPCCEMLTDSEMDRKFLLSALQESMQILTRKEVTVVKKIIIENKPPSSIAEELHYSTRYVRRLKQRALKKMRQYLETHYPSLQVL